MKLLGSRLVFTALALSTAFGCGSDEAEKPTATTYWQDVAPIYFERCVGCHQEGGIGPFRLDTYASAKLHADSAAQATADRVMPPWLVTDDGTCGEFQGSPVLPDEAIATIGKWVADGALEGDPRDDLRVPEVPHLATGVDISTPDFFPEIVGGPLAESDEYRCFLVDPQLESDVFITAHDVLPGNPALVHHVLVMPVDPTLDVGGRTNLEVIQALDNESPDRDGWPCYSAAGEGVAITGFPVSWAPGQGVVEMPAGTGMRVRQGELLVIQMHYNLADEDTHGQSDQTTVRLRMADEVEREGFVLLSDLFLRTLANPEPDTIEPRNPAATVTWDLPVRDLLGRIDFERVDLYGGFPHMHQLGTKQRVELVSDTGTTCISDVARWDFHWQLFYFFRAPVTLDPSMTLRVTCEYDTRDRSEPVRPGWGTDNEMCLFGMYVVP